MREKRFVRQLVIDKMNLRTLKFILSNQYYSEEHYDFTADS